MKIRSNGKKAAAPGSVSRGRLKCRLAAAVLLLVISAALMALAAKQPEFAEWYSENVYSLFVNSLGRLWGLVSLFRIRDGALYTGSGGFPVPGSSGQERDPWRSTLALLHPSRRRYPGISLHYMLWDQLSQKIFFRRGRNHHTPIHGTGSEGHLSLADRRSERAFRRGGP